MAVLAQGGVQLGLQIGGRAGLCPGGRSPPSVSRGKALSPSIEPIGVQTQLLGDNLSGLAAGEPVVDRFMLEGFGERTTAFNRCFMDGLHHTRLAQFSLRQFEATSTLSSIRWRRGSGVALPRYGRMILKHTTIFWLTVLSVLAVFPYAVPAAEPGHFLELKPVLVESDGVYGVEFR